VTLAAMVRLDQGEGRRWRYEKCWRFPVHPMEEERRTTAGLSALQGKIRRARCWREGKELETLEEEREMQGATASDDAWSSVLQLQMGQSRVRMMEDEE
jgi:hypothetical protein